MASSLLVVALGHTAVLGGAELALARLLDAVDADDVATRVVLFADGPLTTRLRGNGHTVDVVPLGQLTGASRHEVGRSAGRTIATAAGVLPFAVRLASRLRHSHADVLYANTLKAGLIGVPLARLLRVPVVWHIHDRISPDYLPPRMVRLVRAVARRASAVIVNSEATAATLPGIETLVAYPGFDPSQAGPPPSPDRPRSATVGILGRISPTKGQLEFVRAAAQVRASAPDARFRVIGSPMFGAQPYSDEVHAEVARLGLDDVVEFTGFVEDPRSLLDDLAVCVHASPTPEPFGQVIVEAMIRGVPVVATRGGGVDEIVEPPDEEPLGWLVEPHDIDGMAAAILEALGDPEESTRRASVAYASALRRFPIEETARVVTGVWRRVARGR